VCSCVALWFHNRDNLTAAWALWAGWIFIFAVGGFVVIEKILRGQPYESNSENHSPFCCSLLPRRWDTMLYSLNTKQLFENNKDLDEFMNEYFLVDQLRLSYQFIVNYNSTLKNNLSQDVGKNFVIGSWECAICAVKNPMTNLACRECQQVST
jgi:hypothetical protein